MKQRFDEGGWGARQVTVQVDVLRFFTVRWFVEQLCGI
jgi:hypothetical protein